MNAQIKDIPTVVTEIAEYSQTAAVAGWQEDAVEEAAEAYQIQRDRMATS